MKTQKNFFAGAKYGLLAVALSTLVLQTRGQTINDQNSAFQFNTSSGATAWTVDGVNQLANQSFYFRVGPTGPESGLSSITSTPTVNMSDPRHLDVLYANANMSVDVYYILTGNANGSGISGINATVTVKNLTGSAMDMHFFQYSDFILGGSSLNQSGLFMQSAGHYSRYSQTLGSLSLTDTFSSPVSFPTAVEAALYNQTYLSLTDGNPTTLNGIASAGPGNVTGAIQWDVSLQAMGVSGDALGISELMTLRVPEPSTAALTGLLGILSAVSVRRSRRMP